MSDILMAQILIMLFLAPVLLRPFSSRLRSVTAFSLVPLLALGGWLLSAVAFSVRLSLVPLFLLIVLLNVTNFYRLLRFIRGLPAQWYGAVAKIVDSVMIVLFAGVLALLVIFPVEPARLPRKDVQMQIRRMQLANGLSALVEYSRPIVSNSTVVDSGEGLDHIEADSRPETALPLLILLTAAHGEPFGRPTLRSVFNDEGFAVLSARFDGLRLYSSPLLSVSFLRPFLFNLNVLTGLPFFELTTGDAVLAKRTELLMLLDLSKKLGEQHSDIFIFAEGSAALAVLEAFEYDPDLFTGCVLFVTEPLSPSSIPYQTLSLREGMMLPDDGLNRLLVLTASPSDAVGFGEIAAEDAFSAQVLGIQHDKDRKATTLLARRVLTWLQLRMTYDYSGM